MKLPNFLIVGAAKSGTTSLYHYLRQHPEVYMSLIKEPKFITAQFLKFPFRGIGDDVIEKNIVKSYKDYCQLFRASNDKKAVGEASPDNLYYNERAIEYIKRIVGNPKVVIILRNPIDRAFSSYMHLIRDDNEFLTFEKALEQEKVRLRDNWEFIWFYKDVGFYYKQVNAYIKNFSQVKIYLYDDLKKDTLGLMKDMYEFLEVNSSFVPDVSTKYNVTGFPRNKFLHEFLTKPNIFKSMIKPFVRIFFTQDKRGKIMINLTAKNLKKPKMKEETRQFLIKTYREDICKLQDLIQRDLTQWLR